MSARTALNRAGFRTTEEVITMAVILGIWAVSLSMAFSAQSNRAVGARIADTSAVGVTGLEPGENDSPLPVTVSMQTPTEPIPFLDEMFLVYKRRRVWTLGERSKGLSESAIALLALPPAWSGRAFGGRAEAEAQFDREP